MRNKITKSERQKIRREERIQRAIYNIENKGRHKRKMNKSFIYTLVVIVISFSILKFLEISKFQQIYNKPITTVDRFEEEYKEKILNGKKKYDYDKEIETTTRPEEEVISYIQKSSGKTGNYIQINKDSENKVLAIEAIGQYRKDNSKFPVAFKENVLIITSIIFDLEYNEAERTLIDYGILDQKGNLYLKKFNINKQSYRISFDVVGNKFIYTISKNK